MKILALEFSTSHRSVAVILDGVARAESMETGGRTANAFELIDRTLASAATEREQIDCIAVGVGPGSYTGIRAAIAIAQGWELARGPKLIGIGAAPAMAAKAWETGQRGEMNIVIDAQRNEFYLATFLLGNAGPEPREPLRIVTASEAQSIRDRGGAIAGPDLGPLLEGVRPLYPDASCIGRLAAKHPDFVSGESLSPIYLREAGFVKAPVPRIIPPA